MNDLSRMLRPRHIAVFGGNSAAELIRQAEKLGFAGEIWPVHPHLACIGGRLCVPALNNLPSAPDAAFLGINRHASITIAAELAAMGCGGAVAYASGFAETDAEGAALQSRLSAAAGEMPVFGPNCYGFINYLDSALLWPDQFGGAGIGRGVAIITQSGNIGLNITMQARALPLGYMITLGNQATVGHAACIHAMLDDPRVTAIGLHMEGIADPQALAGAAARARAMRVPLIVLKTGRSEAGAQLALSHTASLGGSDAVADAFFRRIGVSRVASIPVLLETLKLLHIQGPLPGRSIASLSCSGGEAALIADAAAQAGLSFAPLSPEARVGLAATLPALVALSNPLDYHTFGWRKRAALSATFAAMMRAGADITLLILDIPSPHSCDTADWDIAAEALADAATLTNSRAAILATLPENLPESYAQRLATAGIVPLCGMEDALAAIAAAADCGRNPPPSKPLLNARPAPVHARTLPENEGKAQLAAFGVAIPPGACAASMDAAVEIAHTIGFPVAMKASGDAISHKTELRALRLNLGTAEAVREAAEALLPLTGSVLVESMVAGVVVELIVGVARDPVLGPYLVFGSGGILAELIGDTATLLLPTDRAEVGQALRTLRAFRLMEGFRGAPPADIEAAIDAVLKVQDFAIAKLDILAELDVNPLMVRVAGHGAIAADVLLRLAPEAADV